MEKKHTEEIRKIKKVFCFDNIVLLLSIETQRIRNRRDRQTESNGGRDTSTNSTS